MVSRFRRPYNIFLPTCEGAVASVGAPGSELVFTFVDQVEFASGGSNGERAGAVVFNQGLRLTYAFNHSEVQRAFRKAQKLDPDCAMCFWGEALVLGPNINLPMQEDAVAPAFAASSRRGIVGISG